MTETTVTGPAPLQLERPTEDFVPPTNSSEPLRPIQDRDACYLIAAVRGRLTVLTEFGAVRGFKDDSGRHTSYLAPLSRGLFKEGLLTRHGDAVDITSVGRAALEDYQRRWAAAAAQPYNVGRDPVRGELHDPQEPLRVLRHAATGAQINPGDTITDPFGDPITYLGPTMWSFDRGRTWQPAFNARVRYEHHGPWLFPPTEINTAYDQEPVLKMAWDS
ncbi:hypothetical protein [Streptomyces sp. NPDC015125]|uniref:hypothetical protein n=1 Tax=Streptomyces sp. NPDC015125 TaxID=3364938 RepID=UPI0036F8B48B